jgi:hypothetical protein
MFPIISICFTTTVSPILCQRKGREPKMALSKLKTKLALPPVCFLLLGIVNALSNIEWLVTKSMLLQPYIDPIWSFLISPGGNLIVRRTTTFPPAVEILSPKNGAFIDLHTEVLGLVSPANSSVQLFIYSGDNLWHTKHPKVVAHAWTFPNCQIGDPIPAKEEYKLVAISGAKQIESDTKISDLPVGEAQSQESFFIGKIFVLRQSL